MKPKKVHNSELRYAKKSWLSLLETYNTCIVFENWGVKYSRTGNVQSVLPVSKTVSVDLICCCVGSCMSDFFFRLDFIVICFQTCLDSYKNS